MERTKASLEEEKARGGGLAAIVRLGLSRSVASLLIKMATAGLTYLMLVILSRSMDNSAYGQFAFGMALATVLAIGASMGQQTAILRFWPEAEVNQDDASARNALQAGWALTLIAGTVLTLGLLLAAGLYGLAFAGVDKVTHILAAALLILPMGVAEYGSSALRAQGSVWAALAPRDILWRLFVPVIVLGMDLAGVPVSGPFALTLTAIVLALAMVLQFHASRQRGYVNEIGFSGLRSYWKKRGKASRWFLMGTVVDSAGLNVDTVLVGLFVTSASAGLYFNAFRTAGLLTLFMFAITLVAAPMVAHHYHAGEMRKAQAVTAFNAWAGFVFSLAVFGFYVLFGGWILSLFGPEYAQGKTILLILSLGLLADAATGPTRIVMMMTGHERDYVRIFGGIMVAGILVQLVVIPIYGVLAAAIVNTTARFLAQTVSAWWTRRHVGIDTSLFGIFALLPGRMPKVVAKKGTLSEARVGS